MAYTVKSSERLRPSAADTETKALLYLMNFRDDSDEIFFFVVDFFNDQREGIFQQRTQVPDFAGIITMPFGNVGRMRSYGSDGNISYTQTFGKDFAFTVRGNFTYSTNDVQ